MSGNPNTKNNNLVQLHLQNDELIITTRIPGKQPEITSDTISNILVSADQAQLTAKSVEDAIARIEDIIMPRIHLFPQNAELEIFGEKFAELARILHADNSIPVSVDNIEYLFNQVADHAAGSAAAWRQPVAAKHVAVALIVLREVMHHGGFTSVNFSL